MLIVSAVLLDVLKWLCSSEESACLFSGQSSRIYGACDIKAVGGFAMKKLCSLVIALYFLFSIASRGVLAGAGSGDFRLPTADYRLALSAGVCLTVNAETTQEKTATEQTKTTNQEKTDTQELKTTSQEKKTAIKLEDYVGRYEADPSMLENFILDVFIEKDELWIKPSHSPKRKLTAKGSDSFVFTDMKLVHKFNRDAKGLVQSMTIEGSAASVGRSVTAKKMVLPAPSLKGNTTFRLKGHAGARIVAVAGSFNDWNQSQVLCAKESAEWVCRIDLAPGKYTYKFIIDGDWILDPDNANSESDERGFENSVVVVQ